MRAAGPLLLALTLGLSLGSAGADEKAGDSSFMDAAKWRRMDPEQRWVTYSARKDGASRADWLKWMAELGDDELLEWSALSEGWDPAGPLLLQRKSPRWVRSAIWALAAMSSHQFENATVKALQREPAIVLAYVEQYPALEKEAPVKKLVDEFRKTQVVAGDASALLPPLDPDEVYAALDAPAKLAVLSPDGTGRVRSKGKQTVYVHQVERALRTLERSQRRTRKSVADLVRLVDHAQETIARQACLAFTFLPSHDLPYEKLLARVDDADEAAGVREAALMAFGSSRHPAVTGRLVAIAADTAHPTWRVAVARLVDHGDPFVLRLDAIRAALDPEPSARTFIARQEKRLRTIFAGRKPKQWAAVAERALQDAAWLGLSGHPLAAPHRAAVREAFLAQRDSHFVHNTLTKLSQTYAPEAWLFEATQYRDEERPAPKAAALRDRVRALALEIIEQGR